MGGGVKGLFLNFFLTALRPGCPGAAGEACQVALLAPSDPPAEQPDVGAVRGALLDAAQPPGGLPRQQVRPGVERQCEGESKCRVRMGGCDRTHHLHDLLQALCEDKSVEDVLQRHFNSSTDFRSMHMLLVRPSPPAPQSGLSIFHYFLIHPSLPVVSRCSV